MITCQTLKQMAKTDMKNGKSFIFKASLLLFVISIIFSLLITFLSGYNRYMNNMNNILAEVYSDPEMLANPTEEFLLELAEEIELAAPKIAPAAMVLIAIIIIMNGMLSAGYEGYCLKVTRNSEVKALDILRSFEHFGKALCLLIIRSAAVAVGSVFFIIPGVIAYYSFSQCFMVMYDHPEYSVFKCLGESARIMRGHKMMFFVLQFSFIGWHIVSDLITSVIGVAVLQIYTKPYIGLAQAHFYNAIIFKETMDSSKNPASETMSPDNEQ
ncbi:MAG: DUF975 family protein [Oscillospiraceae bacterium]|nr:DUF975 family protein [Oscillospiraceae bacterium]